MLAGMTGVQLSEWMAFDRACPPDAIRGAAMVCAAIHNAMGDGSYRFTPADFLPARPAEEQGPEEMKAALMGIRPGED